MLFATQRDGSDSQGMLVLMLLFKKAGLFLVAAHPVMAPPFLFWRLLFFKLFGPNHRPHYARNIFSTSHAFVGGFGMLVRADSIGG